MLSHLASLATSCRDVDLLEIRWQTIEQTKINFLGTRVEHAGLLGERGGCVRAFVNGGWGFASFNDPDLIEAKIAEAVKLARLAGSLVTEKFRLAPAPTVKDKVVPQLDVDPRQVPLERKIALLDEYNQIMLGHHPAIVSTSIRYFDTYTKTLFVNSEGTVLDQEFCDLGMAATAQAKRDNLTQVGICNTGSSAGFGVVLGLQEEVARAAERAVMLLDAPPVKGGQYTVLLDPRLAGVFAHEAFGHLSEADFQADNPELRKVMTLGAQFGNPELNIYDDGRVSGARGFLMYDDEGVPTERTYLIKEGRLVGRLHSRETAGKMNERPTGNARAMNYLYRPICRMRTTGIERGTAWFEDMIRDVRLGVYAIGSFGGETAGEMFTFTASYAYMIRDGQLAEPVRDVTLTGNLFTTLKNIDMIGSDERVVDSFGGCGKGDQAPLQTTEAAPHIRIRDVIVGGAG